MALEVGSRLGHYDVTALIGEGGMGQVYQATDTKLNRQVALKILPEAFASDPDRLARFQREAQVLASLNHPNIAAIHGLEDSEGTKALVLELVEGPTLADRIAQGPIPVDEALPIAKQIAEALEAAHEAGVIHRDLKPANIKVKGDGTVKVLDFGLAKALDTTPEGDPSQSPTLTAAATQMGVIMGTAAYMSPEQAKGRTVDKRGDVWAFGAVLYEMLTGKRAFAGSDISEVLASVLAREPDWTLLPLDVSPVLGTYMRRCLQKDPKQRIGDVQDVRLALEGAFETTMASASGAATPQTGWRQVLPWVAGLGLAVVTGLAVWDAMRPQSQPVVRLTVAVHDTQPLSASLISPSVAFSSGGDQLAYLTGSAGIGAEQLHVRPLAARSSETLVAGGQLANPFFSPDGQSVGFLDRSTTPFLLKRIGVRDGATSTICDLPEDLRGASWGGDDTIIFGMAGGGLWRVAAAGGVPEPLTTPDPGEGGHIWPKILPGGGAVLFTIATGIEEAEIAVLSLDTLEHEVIIPSGTFPQYSPTGHLVYGVQGNLWAVEFDVDRLETVGSPVPVQEDVFTTLGGAANFGVSANGSLVYMTGGVGGGEALRSLVWVDRLGNEEALPAEPQLYSSVQLSPDDRQAVAQVGVQFEDSRLLVLDLERNTPRRFTTDSGINQYPVYSPNGERILWQSFQHGASIVWKATDGTGQVEPLTESSASNFHAPSSWSSDGQTLVMNVYRSDTDQADIGLLAMDGERTINWVLEGTSSASFPDVSPDGRWMAYTTDESGQPEVYVTPFPNVGEDLWKISQDGGLNAQWGPDSRELFFQTRDGTIMVATNETEPTFTHGTPVPVFDAPYWLGSIAYPARAFDISSDGQRLLVIKEGGMTNATDEESEIHVVLNWTEELTRLVPAN